MAEVFYTDKSKLIDCKIKIQGGSLKDAQARLRLKFDNGLNYLVEGDIKQGGRLKINVPALKDAPDTKGNAILEVITENTFFEPWQSKFEIEQHTSVEVDFGDNEVEEKTTTPTITIERTKEKLDDVIRTGITSADKKFILEIVKTYSHMSPNHKNTMKTIVDSYNPNKFIIKEAKKLFTNIDDFIPKLYMYYLDTYRLHESG